MGMTAEYLGTQTAHGRNDGCVCRHVFDTWCGDSKLREETIDWCIANFGSGTIEAPRWMIAAGFLYIIDDNDAFAFRMRWC